MEILMKAGDLNKYDLVKNTLVLILAGGRGSRLHELTDKRAKPALYFGGNRRIIDFALSNCINSGLNRIGVVTQYAAHSLLRHLQTGWSFLPQEKGEFVDMLPARQQLMIQLGIVVRLMLFIKIWRLFVITIVLNMC